MYSALVIGEKSLITLLFIKKNQKKYRKAWLENKAMAAYSCLLEWVAVAYRKKVDAVMCTTHNKFLQK